MDNQGEKKGLRIEVGPNGEIKGVKEVTFSEMMAHMGPKGFHAHAKVTEVFNEVVVSKLMADYLAAAEVDPVVAIGAMFSAFATVLASLKDSPLEMIIGAGLEQISKLLAQEGILLSATIVKKEKGAGANG